MKGIILSGGKGTRLGDATAAISKQLLPVYDKPMIYYPLTVLKRLKINEIAIICTSEQLPNYKRLLDPKRHPETHFEFFVQDQPRGLAEAYTICEGFLDYQPSCMVLGDNIMHGSGFTNFIEFIRVMDGASENLTHSWVLGYPVADPSSYGVVEIDDTGYLDLLGVRVTTPTGIVEKPVVTNSNLAVPGIYVLDGGAPRIARGIKPSKRGELEIADLLSVYIKHGTLDVVLLPQEDAWFDCGTPDRLLEASSYIAAAQKRTGTKIGCPF